MKKKNNSWSHFLQKIRFKYKITVLNENTLEESWHVRLSRFSVFLLASLFTFITFLTLTLLIVFTPIRYYLPGYIGSGDRTAIIGEAMKIDSLLQEMSLHTAYLDMLKSIISGEIRNDSLPSLDSITLKERAEVLMERSKAEREFVDRFEREEKFNLSALTVSENPNIFVFFKPVSGII